LYWSVDHITGIRLIALGVVVISIVVAIKNKGITVSDGILAIFIGTLIVVISMPVTYLLMSLGWISKRDLADLIFLRDSVSGDNALPIIFGYAAIAWGIVAVFKALLGSIADKQAGKRGKGDGGIKK